MKYLGQSAREREREMGHQKTSGGVGPKACLHLSYTQKAILSQNLCVHVRKELVAYGACISLYQVCLTIASFDMQRSE